MANRTDVPQHILLNAYENAYMMAQLPVVKAQIVEAVLNVEARRLL